VSAGRFETTWRGSTAPGWLPIDCLSPQVLGRVLLNIMYIIGAEPNGVERARARTLLLVRGVSRTCRLTGLCDRTTKT
jgi:hypothetical protein